MIYKRYLFSIAMLIASAAMAQTNVYVGPTGTDAFGFGNNAATPYRTIAFAVAAAQSNFNNAVVNVAPGTYAETTGILIIEALTLRKTVGSSGAVVINASGRTPTPAEPFMLAINGASNVTIDGIGFQNFIGKGAKAIWVLGASSGVTVRNCNIRNIGWTNNNLALLPPDNSYSCNAILVQGSTATPLRSVRLLNDTVRNCATGWGEAITFLANVDSFWVESNVVDSIANIGIVAAGNYRYDVVVPVALDQARNGFIRNNKVSNCMSAIATAAGIYMDGSINCTVEANRVWRCGTGISVGAEKDLLPGAPLPGGHTIRNNVLYSNVVGGLFLGSGNPTNAIYNTGLYNNTLYHNRTGAIINGVTTLDGQSVAVFGNEFGGELFLGNIGSATVQNNIFYPWGNRRAIVSSSVSTISGYNSDYNLYHRDGTGPLFWLTGISFNGQALTGDYDGLLAFRAATGLEPNSNASVPGFVDAAADNFALANGALAIDKGNPIYNAVLSGTTDYAGNPRVDNDVRIDCGAYEYKYGTVYTFTGNGNWDVPANWLNSSVPPQTLPAGAQIIINSAGSGTCTVNRAQTVSTGASIIIKPGKKLLLPGNLTIN